MKMNVKRSIQIDAPASKVKETVADFKTWPTWSPWLIAEPDCKVNFSTDGKSYDWEGKRVGSGEMDIKATSDHKVDYNLRFLKPWKSKADVSFILKENNGKTDLTWTMDSSWPIFLFFMKKKTEAFIGSDYERGLLMLKEYVETGKINSQLDFKGSQPFEGTKYVGIKRETSLEGMKQSMGSDFGTLMGKINSYKAFTIYHKFDFVNDKVSYTACLGVDEIPSDLPSNWVTKTLPAGQMQVVRHTGSYDHLGNPWSAVMMMKRNKEFKSKKGYDPMEFYKNSPQNTPPEELITDICFLMK